MRRFLEIAVIVAFLSAIVWSVVSQWDRFQDALGELSYQAVGLSGIAVLAGIWCSFLCWRAVFEDLGGKVPFTAGMRIFFVGQTGKYVPGKVWPILTQARLGREYNVPQRVSAAAGMLLLPLTLGTGLLLAALTLPLIGIRAVGSYAWFLLALPVALVALWPPIMNRGLNFGLRLVKRPPLPTPLTVRGIARSVGWAVVMWVCYGAHLWVLLIDLGADADLLYLLSTGIYAAAWSVGILTVISPAGLGPREAAMVFLLAPIVTQPAGLVAALVSRLLMTIGDLAWPVVSLLIDRRRPNLNVESPTQSSKETAL